MKSAFDRLIAFALLVALSPLLVVTAIMILVVMGRPVFFRQKRPGRFGRPFTLNKFRTMVDKRDTQGELLPNIERMTRLGRILRFISVDELPQLVNVLKGDMSLVGPRPERPEFVEDLNEKIPYYHLRHSVRPGITGWAQILYKYGSSVEDAKEKLRYDLYYIKNSSVGLDMLIVFNTVKIVLLGRGAK